MSDARQGPGWWQASDGKWYPPETHASNRPPPPSLKPAKAKGGFMVWKIALGVVLGLFASVITCSAIIGGAATKITNDAKTPAVVSVQASGDVCWTATLTGTGVGLGQSQHDGCGSQDLEMPTGLGANAIVTKAGGGVLTVTLTVGGKERARQTTDAQYGSVTVSR